MGSATCKSRVWQQWLGVLTLGLVVGTGLGVTTELLTPAMKHWKGGYVKRVHPDHLLSRLGPAVNQLGRRKA